jgi:hypothetical protein
VCSQKLFSSEISCREELLNTKKQNNLKKSGKRGGGNVKKMKKCEKWGKSEKMLTRSI